MYDASSSCLPFLSLVMLGGAGRLFEDAKWDKDWSRGTAWRKVKVCIACFLALTLVSFSFPPHEGCSWLKITSFARAVAGHVASALGPACHAPAHRAGARASWLAQPSCRFPQSEGDTWLLLNKLPPMIPQSGTRCSPRGCVTLEKGHWKWWRTCPTSSSSDRNCGS